MEKTDGGKQAEDWGGETKSGESQLEGRRGNGGQISAFPAHRGKCPRQIGMIASTEEVKQTVQQSHAASVPGAVCTRNIRMRRQQETRATFLARQSG